VRASIHSIVLKLASHCNLNCSYCYVYNHEDHGFQTRPNFLSDEVLDALLGRMRDYSAARKDHGWTVGFHGGEPTLVGMDRMRRIIARAREVLGEKLEAVSLQTNATLIDSAWARALLDDRVAVSVSLDGNAAAHDAFRVDHKGRGSYAETVRGIRALQDAGHDLNVLCVLNPWSSGREAYGHIRSLDVKRMDFLFPDVSHDNHAALYGMLPPLPVARYMNGVFDAWMEEDNPRVTVRFFRDLLQRLLGSRGVTDTFSSGRSGYVIVETDGEIEANDALRVCADGIARSSVNVVTHGFDDLAQGRPLVHQAVTEGFPLPQGCRSCPERDLCGGGYLPHRYSKARGFDNPSVWCADLLDIFSHVRTRLALHDAALAS